MAAELIYGSHSKRLTIFGKLAHTARHTSNGRKNWLTFNKFCPKQKLAPTYASWRTKPERPCSNLMFIKRVYLAPCAKRTPNIRWFKITLCLADQARTRSASQ